MTLEDLISKMELELSEANKLNPGSVDAQRTDALKRVITNSYNIGYEQGVLDTLIALAGVAGDVLEETAVK